MKSFWNGGRTQCEQNTKHVEAWVTNVDSFCFLFYFILEDINHQYEKIYIFFYFMIISVWCWLCKESLAVVTNYSYYFHTKDPAVVKMIKSKNKRFLLTLIQTHGQMDLQFKTDSHQSLHNVRKLICQLVAPLGLRPVYSHADHKPVCQPSPVNRMFYSHIICT